MFSVGNCCILRKKGLPQHVAERIVRTALTDFKNHRRQMSSTLQRIEDLYEEVHLVDRTSDQGIVIAPETLANVEMIPWRTMMASDNLETLTLTFLTVEVGDWSTDRRRALRDALLKIGQDVRFFRKKDEFKALWWSVV